MIIDLKFKNWMSFRDETKFSLAAAEERRLKARIPKIRKSPVLSVSPIAVLYGGNASGKTNLFSLFAFLKKMVVLPLRDEEKEIPLDCFALSRNSSKPPTEILLSFLASDDKIYTLRLLLSRKEVLEESLALVKSSGETVLYSRKNNNIKLHSPALEKNKDAHAYVRLIAKNQLFIGVAGLKIPQLQAPYQWFRNQLTLINTHSSFRGFWDMFSSEPTDIQYLAGLLKQLDTGICKLAVEDSTFAALPLKDSESELKEHLNDDSSIELNFDGLRYVISKKDDQLMVKKMISYHKDCDDNLIKFDLSQESEGSLRLLDILPAFIDLERNKSRKVYVIDELDRSWHYALSHRLLGIYLSHCSENSRAQLLFSTHDLMLMDQNLFRRDEMWIAERSYNGVSTLFSLSNCGIRFDKDIRKLYLQGALGGIPQLSRFGSLSDDEEN